MYNICNYSVKKELFILKLMKKAVAVMLALVVMASLSGCGKFTVSREIANVNGRVITEAEFKYYLENVKGQMLSEAGQTASDETFWDAEIDGEKAANVAKNKALDEAIRVELACIKAEELGLKVSDEEARNINMIFASGDSAQKEQIKEIEKTTGLFERLFKETLTKSALANQYAMHISQNEADKITPSDEDINAAYESDYVRIKHVLVKFEDEAAADAETSETTEEVNEEEAAKAKEAKKAEKKALADEIADKAKSGTRFESLVSEYGQDPGMESSPDGYTFAKDGSMVAEFEEAAFALGMDEISAPVETTYGYHILKKYPLLTSGEEYEKIKQTLSSTLMQDKYNALIDSYKADYNIEIKSNIVDKAKVK